jgi:hypothetical protein
MDKTHLVTLRSFSKELEADIAKQRRGTCILLKRH